MSSYFLWPVIMLRRPIFIGSAATAFSGSGSLVGRTVITGSAVIDVGGAASLRAAPPPFVGVAGIQVESTSVLTMVPILAGTANVDIATTGRVFLDMRATSGIELGLAGTAFMSMRANALAQLDSSASLVMAAKMTGAEGFALDVSADMVMAEKMDAEEGFALDAAASLLMASKLEGSAGLVLGATGDMVMAELFVGEQGLELGATGALLMASVLSGSASIELGESVTLTEVEPIIMEGVAGIEVGDATGDMVMALKMDGAAGVELATTGAMVMAEKMEASSGCELGATADMVMALKMAGETGLALAADGTLKKAVKLAGEAAIDLGASATLEEVVWLAGTAAIVLSEAAEVELPPVAQFESSTSIAISTYHSGLAVYDVDLDSEVEWDFENFTPLHMDFNGSSWTAVGGLQARTLDRWSERPLFGTTLPEGTEWPTQQVSYPSTTDPAGFAVQGTKHGKPFFGTGPGGIGTGSFALSGAGPGDHDSLTVCFWVGFAASVSGSFYFRVQDVFVQCYPYSDVGGAQPGRLLATQVTGGSIETNALRIQPTLNARLFGNLGVYERHFVCIRRTKGGSFKLTVDGATVSRTADASAPGVYNAFQMSTIAGFGALFDFVQYFDRFVSDAEVETLYRRRQPLVSASSVALGSTVTTLRTDAILAGSAAIEAGATATLRMAAIMSGSAAIDVGATATLKKAGTLIGPAAIDVEAAGPLRTGVQFASTAAAVTCGVTAPVLRTGAHFTSSTSVALTATSDLTNF